MSDIRIEQLIPAFILADRNGYALAKGVEKLLRIMEDTVRDALDAFSDPDKMPEWRLDELAWEYNCLYDYDADVEAKRQWIRDAVSLQAALGTPQAIYNYLNAYFDQVELEEWWQYGGQPYHFRVSVSGAWNEKNEAWLKKAIEYSKNVRSVLDDITLGSETGIIVSGEGGVLARYRPPLTGDDLYAGTYPEESVVTRFVDDLYVAATRDAQGYVFPYPQAMAFSYPLCGNDEI